MENGLFDTRRWAFYLHVFFISKFRNHFDISEGAEQGEIVWKFDFSSADLKIESYNLRFERKTFGEGQIEVNVISDSGSANIIGASVFEIKAVLSGGKGDIAWQHAQLFRQSLNQAESLFDLQINFI